MTPDRLKEIERDLSDLDALMSWYRTSSYKDLTSEAAIRIADAARELIAAIKARGEP